MIDKGETVRKRNRRVQHKITWRASVIGMIRNMLISHGISAVAENQRKIE